MLLVIGAFCFQETSRAAAIATPKASLIEMLQAAAQASDNEQYQYALSMYDTAISHAKQDVPRELIALIYQGKAEILRRQGHLPEAITNAQHCVDIRLSLGDEMGAAEGRCIIANALLEQGHAIEPLRIYLAALRQFRRAGDFEMERKLLGNLGCLYERAQEYEKSLFFHNQALASARQAGDLASVAATLLNLGVCLQKQGNYESAKERFQESWNLATVGGSNVLGQVRALVNLAGLDLAEARNSRDPGTSPQLESSFERASQALALTANDGSFQTANSQALLGAILMEKRDFEGAWRRLTNALQEFERSGLLEEQRVTVEHLGEVSRRTTNLLEAAMMRVQAAALQKRLRNSLSLPAEQATITDLSNRVAALTMPRTTEEKAERVIALLQLASALHGNSPGSECPILKVARDAARDVPKGMSWLGRLSSERLAACYEGANAWRDASSCWLSILKQLEQDPSDIPGTHSELRVLDADIFGHAAYCLSREGRHLEALDVADNGKSWLLQRYMEYGGWESTNSLRPDELARYRAVQERLADAVKKRYELAHQHDFSSEIGSINARIANLGAELSSLERASLSRLCSASETLSPSIPKLVADIHRRLGKQVTVIEYAISGSNLLLMCIVPDTSGRLSCFSTSSPIREISILSSLSELTEEVAQTGNINAPAYPSRRLYDLLIRPLEQWLPQTGPIAIVPHGLLWRVPFAALADEDGRYLCQRHTIFLAPSIRTLDTIVQRQDSRPQSLVTANGVRQFLVVADPAGDSMSNLDSKASQDALARSFDPIPGTGLQAQALVSLLGRSATVVHLQGTNATREKVLYQLGRCDWIHIATHGEYDPNNPLLCGLYLAPQASSQSPEALDFLGFRDLSFQSLHARMVVLCSCNSARGRIKAGEGLVGMAWGFLAAGSSSCIGTQWEAVDSAATVFMTNFYANLSVSGTASQRSSKWSAEILAETQKRFVTRTSFADQKWRLPRYWAQFVLIGDPR